jgi:hypothetical protein
VLKLKRERQRGKEKGPDLVTLARSLIPYLRWALNRRGTTPEELACRMLGIVDLKSGLLGSKCE